MWSDFLLKYTISPPKAINMAKDNSNPKSPTITSLLDDEITREIRRKRIVVWLDKRGDYTEYVDSLEKRFERKEFPFPVVSFRGSHLEIILALEGRGDDIDPESMLIHMPGCTEESIRKTPILEMYAAGARCKIRQAGPGRPAGVHRLQNRGVHGGGARAARSGNGRQGRGQREGGRKKTRGLTLSQIRDKSLDGLKKSCAGANLIAAHGREIDDAGEANVGLASFETWPRWIKAAWSQPRRVGVTEFVFTADHGFLLQADTTRAVAYGAGRDAGRRYALSREPRAEEGVARVALAALGYTGREGRQLFPRDTAVFAAGKAGATFVHGGNSLQERVIPVLTVSHERAAAPETLKKASIDAGATSSTPSGWNTSSRTRSSRGPRGSRNTSAGA